MHYGIPNTSEEIVVGGSPAGCLVPWRHTQKMEMWPKRWKEEFLVYYLIHVWYTMYIYIYIDIYLYLYIHIIRVHTYIYIYIHVYIHMYICIYGFVCVYIEREICIWYSSLCEMPCFIFDAIWYWCDSWYAMYIPLIIESYKHIDIFVMDVDMCWYTTFVGFRSAH